MVGASHESRLMRGRCNKCLVTPAPIVKLSPAKWVLPEKAGPWDKMLIRLKEPVNLKSLLVIDLPGQKARCNVNLCLSIIPDT